MSPRVPTLSVIVPATNAPPTLAACLAAIRACDDPPEEVIVATEGRKPAAARNEGAARATQDVLVFLDADVLPHPDAFVRIRAAFEADTELAALFGSYDDDPADRRLVSRFRNLLHHHVHQGAAGPATTFWTGLGAVRRSSFEALGGFDPEQSWLEDIELGIRLVRAGGSIRLDPGLQGKHLKAWSLSTMVWTDFARRGVPWVELLLRYRGAGNALNLGWRHRLSALASLGAAWGMLRRRPALAAGSLGALALANASFYALLARSTGRRNAVLGVGLHAIHHLTAVLSIPAGIVAHLRRGRRR
jgi:glycosyltransferase involved in cell wall biosynthesis